MKIKLSQLKSLIKEEVTRAMNEMDSTEGPPSLIVDLNDDLTYAPGEGRGRGHFIAVFKQACNNRELDCADNKDKGNEDLEDGTFRVFNDMRLPKDAFVKKIQAAKDAVFNPLGVGGARPLSYTDDVPNPDYMGREADAWRKGE